MRREPLALHLPTPERVKANLRSLAEQSGGVSGGEILNICLNAIYAGSRDPDPAKWLVTEEMLLREVRRAMAAKDKHSGRRGRGAEDWVYGLKDCRFVTPATLQQRGAGVGAGSFGDVGTASANRIRLAHK